MSMPKTKGPVAKGAGCRLPWKQMVVAAFLACALSPFASETARATPPQGFTATNLVGPVMLGEIQSLIQTPGYGAMIKTRGPSDVYITHIKIVPGGHGGWHRAGARISQLVEAQGIAILWTSDH